MRNVIAIDGPAASGKSSAGRRLANKIGYLFVSSGELYRLATFAVLKMHGLDPHDNEVASTTLALCIDTTIEPNKASFSLPILSNSTELTSTEVNGLVSRVARVPETRDLVNRHLHSLATEHNLVVEGRDIGSYVFPKTPYKFYIDASPEERARRRSAEGRNDQVAARDRADSTRQHAPLQIPRGATVIDSTLLSLDEVVSAMVNELSSLNLQLNHADPPQ